MCVLPFPLVLLVGFRWSHPCVCILLLNPALNVLVLHSVDSDVDAIVQSVFSSAGVRDATDASPSPTVPFLVFFYCAF